MYFLQDEKCSKKSYIKPPPWGLQMKWHKVTHASQQSKLNAINKLHRNSSCYYSYARSEIISIVVVYCERNTSMVNYLICSCVLLLHCCVILILDLGHRNEDELVQTSTRGYCNPIAYSLELSTNLR